MNVQPIPSILMQPDNYLVWDIETGQPPEADIDAAITGKQLPEIVNDDDELLDAKALAQVGITDSKRKALIDSGDLPEPVKDGRKNAWSARDVNAALNQLNTELRNAAINKGALTSTAPIICVAFKGQVGTSQIMIGFHSMGAGIPMPELEAMGWTIVGSDSEEAMLKNISDTLDVTTDEGTTLAGHNIIKFDFPKIRNRMIRCGQSLPVALQPGSIGDSQPAYDTMLKAKYFCVEAGNGPFFSFKALETALGISNPGHKEIMSGADIPIIHAEAMAAKASGDTEKHHELAKLIMLYNCQDAIQEEKAFRMMTGRKTA